VEREFEEKGKKMNRHNIDKTLSAIAPSAGGAGTMTAIAMDWTGFDFVQYTLNLGVATSGGTVDMKVTECATSGGTYTDITSAALTQVTKAAGDSKTENIDVKVNPAKPFQKIVLVVGTAAFPNSVTGRGYGGSGNQKRTQDDQKVIVR
jgi:hypothetical protein